MTCEFGKLFNVVTTLSVKPRFIQITICHYSWLHRPVQRRWGIVFAGMCFFLFVGDVKAETVTWNCHNRWTMLLESRR